MKKLFILLCLAVCTFEHCSAQLVYENGQLGFNLPIMGSYDTRWGGTRHSWENVTPYTSSIEFVLLGNNVSIGATSQSNRIVFYSYKLSRYNDIMCQNILQASDYNLKTNIVPLNGNLNSNTSSYNIGRHYQMTDVVRSLNPVSFKWKDDLKSSSSSNTQYGFIAQEVMQVLPDIVSETDDGTLAVNYIALIPILTTSIQELSAKIEELEAKIEELQK